MSVAIALLALVTLPAPQQQTERNVEIVNEIVRAIGRGTSIDAIEGLPEIENSSDLEALNGCNPVLRSDSTLRFMHVEFHCETVENPYLRTATFIFENEELSSVHLSSVSGIGPTVAAQESDDLPSERSQFSDFTRAVRNSGDVTVGGLVPIVPEQEELLRSLSSCTWQISSNPPRRTRNAVVDCRQGNGLSYLINMEFDSDGRALRVVSERGSRL